jgi:hypothetical protein
MKNLRIKTCRRSYVCKENLQYVVSTFYGHYMKGSVDSPCKLNCRQILMRIYEIVHWHFSIKMFRSVYLKLWLTRQH